MKNKVYTIFKENMTLKNELKRLVNLIQENETKHKGFRLVEDAFVASESAEDMDKKALAYMEEIFKIDRAALFIDEDVIKLEKPLQGECSRVVFVNEKILRYAYVEKRPYFGCYLDGLISDFHIIPDIASYLIAPIIENGKIIASLNLYSADSEKLSGDAHMDFIQELVLRVGITLRKLHNNASIRFISQYGLLNGAYNSGINLVLQQYIDRHKTSGDPLPFVLIDYVL
ncbi:MAG: GAF domain-containing protein [Deferribacteraceae bacterium]|nr:GAF domain-containing protein [Deferribacteraceae bacterium]